ncbi:MAG: hypothetical protein AAGA30_07650, partial [Planctomycetota bacterium]
MERFISLIVTCLMVVALQSNAAVAIDTIEPECRNDQIWLVSARGAACRQTGADKLPIQQYCCGRWANSDWLQINKSADGFAGQTLVYIHGYQTNLEHARVRGLEVYKNLFGRCRISEPIRFVIWAWKSEKEICRPVQDYQLKSNRAVLLGNLFADSLNYLGPKPPVIIGYSLGVQVIVSGLTKSQCYQGAPVSIATIAAASDCGFTSSVCELCTSGRVKQTVVF